LVNFTHYKKIIVENKYTVPGYTSILKRYICFNSNYLLTIGSNKDANVELRIKRLSTVEHQNEYIPYGGITIQLGSQSLKNIYLMPKVRETDDWSDEGNLSYELIVEYMNYRPMVSYNDAYHPGYSAQFNQYYNAANSQYNNGIFSINKAYRQFSQIDHDDLDD
jgi:hypothetical protein